MCCMLIWYAHIWIMLVWYGTRDPYQFGDIYMRAIENFKRRATRLTPGSYVWKYCAITIAWLYTELTLFTQLRIGEEEWIMVQSQVLSWYIHAMPDDVQHPMVRVISPLCHFINAYGSSKFEKPQGYYISYIPHKLWYSISIIYYSFSFSLWCEVWKCYMHKIVRTWWDPFWGYIYSLWHYYCYKLFKHQFPEYL